jgi:hypothetical protein
MVDEISIIKDEKKGPDEIIDKKKIYIIFLHHFSLRIFLIKS